ncbi:MAG: hypothetical protein IPH75_16410 [bacterium]|nr:hypothetical protein [bacterium]
MFKELLPIRADELAATAVTVGALKFVDKAVDGMDATTAGQLGSTVAERINGVALLVADGRLLISVGSGLGLYAGELSNSLCPDRLERRGVTKRYNWVERTRLS